MYYEKGRFRFVAISMKTIGRLCAPQSHGPFTLPPFAPDARLKYHCALYMSSHCRWQSDIWQQGFSLYAFLGSGNSASALSWRTSARARYTRNVPDGLTIQLSKIACGGSCWEPRNIQFLVERFSPLTYKDKKAPKINLFSLKSEK